MRRTFLCYPPRRGGGMTPASSIRPLEVFRTLQLGAYPSPNITRKFLEVHFSKELLEKNITPTKLQALEVQSCNALLRQLFQSKFLSVPSRIIAFDVEFSGLPNFTNEGPTEDIIELGAFCPIRGKVFSVLVKTEKTIPEAVVKLTGITNELLEKEGVDFEEAWRQFTEFIETDDWVQQLPIAEIEASTGSSSTAAGSDKSSGAAEEDQKKKAAPAAADKKNDKEHNSNNNNKDSKKEGDGGKKKGGKPQLPTAVINAQGEKSVWYDPVDIVRIPDALPPMTPHTPNAFKPKVLLVSHGGKLADIAMIEWALKRVGQTLPETYKFADSHNIIQDLHQRRPVTQDKHPPSFKLSDLCQWLKTKVPQTIHRAGPDAAMTWQALFHTLDRYGDESRTPHQQLVLRFFENDAIQLMSEADDPNKTRRAMGMGADGMGGGAIGDTQMLDNDTAAGMQSGGGHSSGVEDDMSILDLDLDSILKE